MEWNVLLHSDFEFWLMEQEAGVRISISSYAKLLAQMGPALGRPHVDTLKGSRLKNLKELRVQYQGEPWRVLFVFDPRRQAVLLVGGCKQGNDRWYKEIIPLAEKRYQQHLEEMEQNDGTNA